MSSEFVIILSSNRLHFFIVSSCDFLLKTIPFSPAFLTIQHKRVHRTLIKLNYFAVNGAA